MADLRPLAPVAAVGLAYWMGLQRLWLRAGRGRVVPVSRAWCFAAGLVVVAGALASPLDVAAASSLTAHMVQHVLLLMVAGPLLALGMPLPTLLWALPDRLRGPGLRTWRRALATQRRSGWVAWVAGSVVLASLVMWLWHAPALYQAADRNAALHGLEHFSFLLVAVVQWWALTGGHPSRRAGAALAVFIAAFPGTALGAALLLASHPWYPAYVHSSLSAAMSDQQMAGVVMWAFGGLAYVFGAAALFWTWLSRGEADELPVQPTPLPARLGGPS